MGRKPGSNAVRPADEEERDNRHYHERRKHQKALDKICNAYGLKAAEEGVNQYNKRADCKSNLIVDTEYVVKKLCARSKRRCRVNQKNTVMNTAEMIFRIFVLSRYLFSKNDGSVRELPAFIVYLRRREATRNQLSTVPMSRPIAIQISPVPAT